MTMPMPTIFIIRRDDAVSARSAHEPPGRLLAMATPPSLQADDNSGAISPVLRALIKHNTRQGHFLRLPRPASTADWLLPARGAPRLQAILGCQSIRGRFHELSIMTILRRLKFLACTSISHARRATISQEERPLAALLADAHDAN